MSDAHEELAVDALGPLFEALVGEVEGAIAVVRLQLDDGRTLDVFRADRVREKPAAWRLRGFVGDIRPSEFLAVLLVTVDGRAMVTGPAADAAIGFDGQLVVGASPATRRIADLAELIARRVRTRFGDGSLPS